MDENEIGLNNRYRFRFTLYFNNNGHVQLQFNSISCFTPYQLGFNFKNVRLKSITVTVSTSYKSTLNL